ncbi:9288_t:CDS:1, partial [Paraglomus occultum]
IVLPEHEKEWLTSYVKAENWITESMNDIETEEQIYKEAKRYIIKQFNVLESESQTDKAEGHTTL